MRYTLEIIGWDKESQTKTSVWKEHSNLHVGVPCSFSGVYFNFIRISGSIFIEIHCQSSSMTTFWAWIFSSTRMEKWTCFSKTSFRKDEHVFSRIHGCFNWSIFRWWPILRAILNHMFRDDQYYLPMRKNNKSFQVWGIGSHQSTGYNLHLRGSDFFREHSVCLWWIEQSLVKGSSPTSPRHK